MIVPRASIIRAAVAAGMIALSAHAHADAASSLQSLIQGISNIYTGVPWGLLDYIKRFAASIQAENQKANTTIKNAIEASANYKTGERLRMELAKVGESLQQPAYTCSNIAVVSATTRAGELSRKLAIVDSGRDLRGMVSNSNADSRIASISKRAQQFCTADDLARGRCVKVAGGQLAGADTQASYLFGSPDGSSETYIKGQREAVDIFVDRVVGLTPPTQLQQPAWERSQEGRAYVEMQRRYAAINSMAAYSLRSIAASRTPQ